MEEGHGDIYLFPGWKIQMKRGGGSLVTFLGAASTNQLFVLKDPAEVHNIRIGDIASVDPPHEKFQAANDFSFRDRWIGKLVSRKDEAQGDLELESKEVSIVDAVYARKATTEARVKANLAKEKLVDSRSAKGKKKNPVRRVKRLREESSESEGGQAFKKPRKMHAQSHSDPHKHRHHHHSHHHSHHHDADKSESSERLTFGRTSMSGAVLMMTPDMASQGYSVTLNPSVGQKGH